MISFLLRFYIHVSSCPHCFRDSIGFKVFMYLEEIVKLVVKQCVGLPYTIVTVASCMKGVYDLQEWRNTLNEVSKNVKHSCQKH